MSPVERARDSSVREAYLKENLDSVLGEHGFHERRGAGGHGGSGGRVSHDYLYESSARRLLVRSKLIGRSVPASGRGIIADAILQLQYVLNKESNQGGAGGLLALLTPSIHSKVTDRLNEYIDTHAPSFSWLFLDAMGRYRLKLNEHREDGLLPALETVGRMADQAKGARAWFGPERFEKARGGVFAPKFQWLLKVLLLNGFDRKYWGGPAMPPANVNELAEAASVSQPYASKFVAAARAAGYVKRLPVGFQVRRARELLDEWAVAVRLRSKGRTLRAAPMHPSDGKHGMFDQVVKCVRDREAGRERPWKAVFGGHLVCEWLGIGRSNVRSLLIYIDGDVEAFLRDTDLAPAERGDDVAAVVEPEARDSIFGGHGMVDRAPVTDIIQCYLDVRQSPARGREQAELIYENVLEPLLKRAIGDH